MLWRLFSTAAARFFARCCSARRLLLDTLVMRPCGDPGPCLGEDTRDPDRKSAWSGLSRVRLGDDAGVDGNDNGAGRFLGTTGSESPSELTADGITCAEGGALSTPVDSTTAALARASQACSGRVSAGSVFCNSQMAARVEWAIKTGLQQVACSGTSQPALNSGGCWLDWEAWK
jgi:hypothetical protein